MNIKYKKQYKIIFLVVFVITIYIVNALNVEKLNYYKGVTNIKLCTPINRDSAEIVFNKKNIIKEKVSFAFWEQENGVIVERELQKSCETDVIQVYGPAGILFYGYYLDEVDKKGCLIDETLALELFGSKIVQNKVITYNHKEYIIRSVMKNRNGLFVIQANKEAMLDMVSALDNPGVNSNDTANLLTNSYGIEGIIVELEVLMDIAFCLIYSIPFIIVSIWLFKEIWKYKEKCNRVTSQYILLNIIFWACTVVIVILLFKIQNVPEYLIPPKWSDYDFWRKVKDEISLLLEYLFVMPVNKYVEPMFIYFYKTIFFSFTIIVLLFKLRREFHEKN